MLPTLVVGWRASELRPEEAGRFRKVAGCPSLLQAVRVRGRQFGSRQPSDLNKLAIDREMFSGSVNAGFVLALPFHYGNLNLEFRRGGLCVG